jgi:hypothetical protein
MTEEQLDALWDTYCEAATASGSTENGAVDLYDIDGMDEAAGEMRDAIVYLRAENSMFRELLAEARDDLSTSVDQEYPAVVRRQYPDVERRHFRDMELCRRIETALKTLEPKP